MKKIINYSTSYKQEGLNVSLAGNEITVAKGKLVYNKDYQLEENVKFKIDEEIDTILLIEDLITNEILVAASDGNIDKTKYRLVERLAWKTETEWKNLQIKPFLKPEKAGEYNYEGRNEEIVKKGLAIQRIKRKPRRNKTKTAPPELETFKGLKIEKINR